MQDEIQTQFKSEGEPAFPDADTENDNSADSSSGEETTTDPTQSSEGEENSDEEEQEGGENEEGDEEEEYEDSKNLADHPRWKQREKDWKERFNKQEERHQNEMKNLTNQITSLQQTVEGLKGGKSEESGEEGEPSLPAEDQVPSWFGGDESQWKEFVKWNKSLIQHAQEGAVKKVESKQEASQKAIDEATEYFNNQVSEIENDPNLNPEGEKVDRNKLLKFVLDNELVDTQGRWNYKAGYRLLQAQESQSNEQKKQKKQQETQNRKKIAGATTSEGKSEPAKPRVATSETFRNPAERPW